MSDIGVDLNANDEEPKHALGQIQSVPENGVMKTYKYVQFHQGASAAVAGEVCSYADVATVGAITGASLNNTVATSDISASDDVGAGVLQAVLTDTYCGWLQIEGPATLTGAIAGTPADGNALTTKGSADGGLDVSAAVTDAICAYSIDTSATIIMCCFPR